MNNISFITNSNLKFLSMYLKNNFKNYSLSDYKINILEYGQLYQSLLQKENMIHKSTYCFFLLTIEDIFNHESCFKYNNDYNSIIDNFYELMNSFCNSFKGNIYFFETKKTNNTPFDDTLYDISRYIDYVNEKVKKICNLQFINNFYNGMLFDLNFYLESRCYFSLEYLNYISNKITGIILKNIGRTIKCIVVDLDNTMWGGVLVDDGVNSIKISNDYPDNKWQYFQKVLQAYSEKGVVLCVCSKNNHKLVLEALKDKRNILKESDFLIIKANWERKSKNIYEIALQLNISEEHILFIDDNPIEREEVRQNLPKCNILDIKKICPLHYSQKMYNCPLLYNFNIIDSDLKKKQKYEIKLNFEKTKKSFDNIKKFYMSLNTNITFNIIDENSFDRAFQLTAKTNQFNLNKYIFKQQEFKQYLDTNTGIILEYNDKFTTHDKVGLILLQKKDNDIIIDNIILSCRVFNRDFEKSIFILIEKIAKQQNCNIIGKIKKTDRNTNFHNIYENFGFTYDNINTFFVKDKPQDIMYPDWIKCNDDKINKANLFIKDSINTENNIIPSNVILETEFEKTIVVDEKQQILFSKLSNDYNPIHLDSDYAYKTPYGKSIVYGILGVLKSLEYIPLCKNTYFKFLKVEFVNYINVNTSITIRYYTNRILVYKNTNTLCTRIEYEFCENNNKSALLKYHINDLCTPIENKIPVKNYLYGLNINLRYLEENYPNVFNNLDLLQMFQIINLSTFVGMITPGLYSIFNSFELSYINNDENLYNLLFELNEFDKTYGNCFYKFSGKNIEGKLNSIYRPKRVQQIKIKDIKNNTLRFMNEKVLVVGGSRGLGEVIAKIFYTNGANVTITYFKSYHEALSIHNESSKQINILKYNVLTDHGKINDITKKKIYKNFLYGNSVCLSCK